MPLLFVDRMILVTFNTKKENHKGQILYLADSRYCFCMPFRAVGLKGTLVHEVLVQFFLEYVQIVDGGHSNDVIQWVPGSVEDFLVKVQTVNTDLILFTLPTCAHFAGLQD